MGESIQAGDQLFENRIPSVAQLNRLFIGIGRLLDVSQSLFNSAAQGE